MTAGNKKLLGNALLLTTALIWGMAFVFQRMGKDSVGAFTFVAARMSLSAMFVGLMALVRASRMPAMDREMLRATVKGGLACGVFLAAASLFQQMGLATTTAGKGGFITAMYMLLVPVLSFLLFRRRNSWSVWLAVLLGVAGMYLLCVNERFRLTRGDTLVCVCALLFSGHILCCDHFAPKGDPICISALQFVVAAVICLIPALIVEKPQWTQLASAAIPILYCGILSGGLGYTLQIVAQSFTDPTVASLLMSLESVFAALAGALLLGEHMTMREIAGCVVMFTAIILVQLPLPASRRKERESA